MANVPFNGHTKGTTDINQLGHVTCVMDFAGGANPIYIGITAPGNLKSDATWLIRKFTYDGDNVTDIQFASGSTAYEAIWDNRTSYTYS